MTATSPGGMVQAVSASKKSFVIMRRAYQKAALPESIWWGGFVAFGGSFRVVKKSLAKVKKSIDKVKR